MRMSTHGEVGTGQEEELPRRQSCTRRSWGDEELRTLADKDRPRVLGLGGPLLTAAVRAHSLFNHLCAFVGSKSWPYFSICHR